MATSWCICFCICIVAAAAALNESTGGGDNADPAMVQYLQRLFDSVRGRQPRDGELNLLPDESEGFANTVHCFSKQVTQADDSQLPANKKELQFNISSRLDPSDRLVALELLIKLPEASTASLQGYNISLYEFRFGSSTPELLETHPIISPTSHRYQWLGFNVKCSDTPARENYRLQIEITGQSLPPDSELSSLLDSLKIRLITFTYDNQTMENLGLASGTDTVKRQASATLQTLAAQECSKHPFRASYQQLGWPGRDVTVVAPNPPNFNFCHGHCRSPYGDNRQIYTRHAEIIEVLKQYSGRSNLPSPCCVPTQLTPMSLIYERGGIISMTCFQDVGTCGCV